MGVDVACFGAGWENGPLSDEEMVKLYSQTRINLGFAGVGHSKKLMCLKGRDFEVPMSGGLYLTQNNPELALVYDIGKEIVTYNDEQDCVRKIKWLLNHPNEIAKIQKAGRKRAMQDHSWEKRFDQLFNIAGILS
jgi:spore maturation protein CgeB